MIGNMFTCARDECDNTALKATHNQKYCTSECCKIATNRKIMEKYHERAAIRRGKTRECATCGSKLSRYNERKNCEPCIKRKKNTKAGEASALVDSVSWL